MADYSCSDVITFAFVFLSAMFLTFFLIYMQHLIGARNCGTTLLGFILWFASCAFPLHQRRTKHKINQVLDVRIAEACKKLSCNSACVKYNPLWTKGEVPKDAHTCRASGVY